MQKSVHTHVVQPGELAPGRIGLDMALEVHVVAVFDVVRGERRAEPQRHDRRICRVVDLLGESI